MQSDQAYLKKNKKGITLFLPGSCSREFNDILQQKNDAEKGSALCSLMESTCTCTEKPKSRRQKHIKERKEEKVVQFHTSLVSAQDCGDTDVTMSQMQCWRIEKSCLWDGNRGVGERVSETAWKIQKNLLSIDGPSLSVRGWTSLELECTEMRFAGWKYYLGEEKTNWLIQSRCKSQTEMYNTTRNRFRPGCLRGNDCLGHVLCKLAFTNWAYCIYKFKTAIVDFFLFN